jgi:hypothetical protein
MNRIDRSRSLLGRAVNEVGRVVTWLESTVRLSPEDDGNLILAAAPQPGGQRTGRPRRSFGSHNRGKALPWNDGRRRNLLRQDRRSASVGGRPAATDPGERAGNPRLAGLGKRGWGSVRRFPSGRYQARYLAPAQSHEQRLVTTCS